MSLLLIFIFSIGKGVVAGGVVGGVALLAALATIVLLFWWRRKRDLKRAAQYSVNPFVMSTATDISGPFGDAGSTKSTNFDAERSPQSPPSMGSVSSSLTDCSTRKLVDTYGDNAFPMSRLPPVPPSTNIASTSQDPTSLYPNSNLYYRGPSGSSLQNQSLSNPPFPSFDDPDVPVYSGQETPRSSSPPLTRRTVAE